MSRAFVINLSNASSFVISIKPIKDLYYERALTSGLVLFFDKNTEMMMFAASETDIVGLAKDIEPPESFSYYIIKDEIDPLSDDEIDNIYEAMYNENLSVHIANEQQPIKAIICLN